MVGLVRGSSGWGAYEPGFDNPQFAARLSAAVAPAGLSSLTSLSSHISTGRKGRRTKGGQQPAKGKVLKLINSKI
jgi:hypothetical protein